jgi:hypothetical protein
MKAVKASLPIILGGIIGAIVGAAAGAVLCIVDELAGSGPDALKFEITVLAVCITGGTVVGSFCGGIVAVCQRQDHS